jgi:hypothetical protein
VTGAEAGSVRYSCATSAPVTPPLLAMVAVTVATVSHRSAAPPGTVAPVAGPAVAVLEAVRPESVKFVYAGLSQWTVPNIGAGLEDLHSQTRTVV